MFFSFHITFYLESHLSFCNPFQLHFYVELTINETEKKLGVISASKLRDASSAGAAIGQVALAVLIGVWAPRDVSQKIYATMTSVKSKISGFDVRIDFTRVVWDDCGHARVEPIEDQKIYEDFFEKLGKSVFLTNNNL